MNRLVLIALAPVAVALAGPALAQPMDPNMPGMVMPKSAAKTASAPAKAQVKPKKARAAHAKPTPATPSMPGMAGMPGMAMATATRGSPDKGAMTGMTMPAAGPAAMPGMVMPATPAKPADAMADMPGMKGMAMPMASQEAPEASEPEIPRGPPPPPAFDHAADRFYDPAAMAAARKQLREEHGGSTVSKVMANLAEYQSAPGGGGYRWDGEAWIGGDINRFVVKSEGDGSRRDGLSAAEAQGLVSHAITPYFDLQAGVRQDFAPHARTYATVGFQGLAPYWFDVSGALFLSTKGEVLARVESTYDLRLTQRLILQPRVELNFAAQNTAETRIGSGLSNAELGLRLRYEIRREFAPYIGVSWDRKVGKTADYARARGDDIGGATFVAGIRAWF
jgi:copper resistance protein B